MTKNTFPSWYPATPSTSEDSKSTENPDSTQQRFNLIMGKAYDIFEIKDTQYGNVWKLFRPISMNDQIYIKIKRIRSIQEAGTQKVTDSIDDDMYGIINYCLMMIMTAMVKQGKDIEDDFKYAQKICYEVMVDKNHDYGEAWCYLEKETFVDLMLVKSARIKTLLKSGQNPFDGSKAVIDNIIDICNYAVFYMILYRQNIF